MARRKGNGHDSKTVQYYKVSHLIVSSKEFRSMSSSAQTLYFHLCRLRNRLTKGKNHTSEHTFWRKDSQLETDTGLSNRSVRRARDELERNLFIDAKRKQTAIEYMILDDVYQKEMDSVHDKDALRFDFHRFLPA